MCFIPVCVWKGRRVKSSSQNKRHGGKTPRVETRNNKNAMGYPYTPTHTNGTHKRVRDLQRRSWRTSEVVVLSRRRAFPLGKSERVHKGPLTKPSTARSFLPPKTHLVQVTGEWKRTPTPIPAFSLSWSTLSLYDGVVDILSTSSSSNEGSVVSWRKPLWCFSTATDTQLEPFWYDKIEVVNQEKHLSTSKPSCTVAEFRSWCVAYE